MKPGLDFSHAVRVMITIRSTTDTGTTSSYDEYLYLVVQQYATSTVYPYIYYIM